jgi:hypothetical protein
VDVCARFGQDSGQAILEPLASSRVTTRRPLGRVSTLSTFGKLACARRSRGVGRGGRSEARGQGSERRRILRMGNAAGSACHCPLPTAHCPLPTAHCPLDYRCHKQMYPTTRRGLFSSPQSEKLRGRPRVVRCGRPRSDSRPHFPTRIGDRPRRHGGHGDRK